jgi:hypothetical protein
MLLEVGVRGPEVEAWEWFLYGRGLLAKEEVNQEFDEDTKKATIAFQGFAGIGKDGRVGKITIGVAEHFGFGSIAPPEGLPARPAGLNPLSVVDRARIFGQIPFTPAPTAANPEGIYIEPGWKNANIVSVAIPALDTSRILGAPKGGVIWCHRLAQDDFKLLFDRWTGAGLVDRILSFGGTWAPRFIRGSKTVLSQHAWGSAIDLNVPWNGLGVQPAAKGSKGSLVDLIGIAAELGWFWGGWFNPRKDGMHLERTRE